MLAHPVISGLRRVEVVTLHPVALATFYRRLLGWNPEPNPHGVDCWVGDRCCARIRKPRHREPTGCLPVFAGATQDYTLTGPDNTRAMATRGRAQHGPWAPGPRAGEPCWVELVTAEPARADAFWPDILNLTVRAEGPGADYVAGDRALAGRRHGGRESGWLCFFAVDDPTAVTARAEAAGVTTEVIDHPLLAAATLLTNEDGTTIGLTHTETWGTWPLTRFR